MTSQDVHRQRNRFVYVSVYAFWVLHGGFVVVYGFLLSWYVDLHAGLHLH